MVRPQLDTPDLDSRKLTLGFPGGLEGKESAYNAREIWV